MLEINKKYPWLILAFSCLLICVLPAWAIYQSSTIGGGTAMHVPAGGPTYIHNVLCDDNAASTVVSNDGTASDWAGAVNTSLLHSAIGTNSFLFATSNYYIVSADVWTDETFIIEYDIYHNAATAAEEYIWQIGDGDGAAEANELVAIRLYDDDIFLCSGSGDNCRTTTNYGPSATTWYHHKWTIDCSTNPHSVSLQIDGGAALTWSGSFAYPALTLNANIYFSLNGSQVLNGNIKNILVYSSD